ncbi:MAG: ATPase, T2SS/T4P/T4SS family [Patescibacteria group bacterium]
MSAPTTILLVESNLFIGGILSQKLQQDHYDVATTKDPKEGLHKIVDLNPTVVFLDLPMGKVKTFLGVLRTIQRTHGMALPPIIVLSDVEQSDEITKISELGVKSYLIKAYTDTEEMLAKIKELVSTDGSLGPAITTGGDAPVAPKPIAPVISEQKRIRAEIEKSLVTAEQELPIVPLIDNLILYGYLARSSDIHIKPEQERVCIRLRIDGLLQDVFSFPKNIQSEVITRIKVLAGMRTDEHQAAQDGRFKTNIKGLPRQFDIRVSVVPTYYGENAVLRLLVEQAEIKSLEDLTFSDDDRAKLMHAIERPNGMILATGPTGSGKTTTLYTVLRKLNTPDVSIITIEDPIEYSLQGINQIQVNAENGLTFADGLRSILRQDPDIIMVGEIRDRETASIAVNAALTGHLLLSTLHTNDSATTLPRLLDMGVEPFLIASTVNVAIGQRLVRMICKNCKIKKQVNPAELKSLTDAIPAKILAKHRDFYSGKGCQICGNTGYAGRISIYEVLEVTDEIRRAIMSRGNASEIKKIAIEHGMTTLMDDGFRKALEGLTTIEEILRVIQE